MNPVRELIPKILVYTAPETGETVIQLSQSPLYNCLAHCLAHSNDAPNSHHLEEKLLARHPHGQKLKERTYSSCFFRCSSQSGSHDTPSILFFWSPQLSEASNCKGTEEGSEQPPMLYALAQEYEEAKSMCTAPMDTTMQKCPVSP